jgi:Skp family chaperone for outer membrane proteins
MKKLISLLALAAIAFTGCGKQDTSSSSSESGAASTSNTTVNSTMSGSSTDNTTASARLAPVSQPSGAAASSGTRASTSESNVSSITPNSASWNELRSYTFERRGEFNSSLNAMSSKVDAEIATLKSKASGANADNKQEALKEVQKAKAEFDGKAAALGRASQQQWEESREEVAEAWERLQSALQRARSAG